MKLKKLPIGISTLHEVPQSLQTKSVNCLNSANTISKISWQQNPNYSSESAVYFRDEKGRIKVFPKN